MAKTVHCLAAYSLGDAQDALFTWVATVTALAICTVGLGPEKLEHHRL